MNSGYWQDDEDQSLKVESPIQDLVFTIDQGRQLPVDHAQALASAIFERLPWIRTEPLAGIQQIQAAASGNGWFSPQDSDQPWIILSARTKLILRVPAEKAELAMVLTGDVLDIGGFSLTIGNCRVRTLAPAATLFARYVLCNEHQSEPDFLEQATQQLGAQQISCKRMISGLQHSFNVEGERWFSRSLMLADLTVADSMRLQEKGMGPGRIYGFGLFIQHKDIKRVEPR